MHTESPNTLISRAYTVEGFLELVPIGKSSLYKLLKSRRIKSTIICGRRLIPATEVDRLINDRIAFKTATESDIKTT